MFEFINCLKSKDGRQLNYNNDEINKIVVIFLFEKMKQLMCSKRPKKQLWESSTNFHIII